MYIYIYIHDNFFSSLPVDQRLPHLDEKASAVLETIKTFYGQVNVQKLASLTGEEEDQEQKEEEVKKEKVDIQECHKLLGHYMALIKLLSGNGVSGSGEREDEMVLGTP